MNVQLLATWAVVASAAMFLAYRALRALQGSSSGCGHGCSGCNQHGRVPASLIDLQFSESAADEIRRR